MLEFIIIICVLAFLGFTAIEYYVRKYPLKESVEHGVYMGIIFTAGITTYVADYIKITLGIMMFLLTIVIGYYIGKRPLKDSIKRGLIVGIGYVILIILIRPTMGFYLI